MATMTVVKCPCGTNFSARLADVNRGWGKFCSKSCKTKFAKSTPAPVCTNCNGSGDDPEIPFLDCSVCSQSALSVSPIDDGGQAGPSFEQLGQHLCSDPACECAGTGVIDVPFKREERYIVVKLTDLAKVPANYHAALVQPLLSLQSHLPRREFLVIESDWPEFEPAYQMIEERMTGRPTALERETSERLRGDVAVADCNDAERREAALREELRKWKEIAWRHSEDRDEIQQRLTVAEQRAGELEELLRDCVNEFSTSEASQFELEMLNKILATLKPAEEVVGSTCNQIREESGLPTKNPCLACNNGSCIDR